jgi:aminomuconate-semialdehyde/2-hydroxymuconate-6-semialdehyde dehydrogenase
MNADLPKILNYIGGNLLAPVAGGFIQNIEPATGRAYSLIPDSGPDDVENAVLAAKDAFPAWSNTPYTERSRILVKLADLILENLDALARAESRDNGKPVSLARTVDIPRAESNIRFFATAIVHFSTEAHIMEDSAVNYTTRKPIGVVGCISPWNLPLYLFTWKIAPALAAGNCVVAKPSEITPYTAFMLSELCIKAGLPAGVLNIVHGTGPSCGNAIVSHPEIKAISFTGGTATGKHIASIAAPMFKKLSLELGGKNPNIIFEDCDFDDMLRTTLRSSFANQGQICLCGSRILIQRSLYNRFKEAFVAKVKQMQVGDPSLESTKMGAVVSESHMQKILSFIRLAEEEGGTILCGGRRVNPGGDLSEGYYIEPTVIEGLGPNCRTNQEEIFGPVVTLQPFDEEDDALALANATPYGLSATLWTSNLKRAHRVADKLEAGIVWVNCWLLRDLRTPFGGVKQSGVGREGGFEALRFFTEAKNICIQL